jgi:hypothetical protein
MDSMDGMHLKRLTVPLLVAALVLAACGGGDEAPEDVGAPSTPTEASPTEAGPVEVPAGCRSVQPGDALEIEAEDVSFDTDCASAPSGVAFQIEFKTRDEGLSHNFAIYTDETGSEALFQGEIVSGRADTIYDVDPLPSGTFFFRCDVHPTQMFGIFVAP